MNTIRLSNPGNCKRCGGCTYIATDDYGTPWIFWASLPPGSDLSIKMGLVKPIPCPDCGGTGDKP